jgi:hypothetical protein
MGSDYRATDYYKPHDQLEVMLSAGTAPMSSSS